MLRKLFKKNRKSGFTLVEALVAVSIFTLSVLAMLVSLGQGLSNIDYAKKKKNRKSGVTLVEGLVAVSIFPLSVLAMLVSLGQGLSNIDYAKKKLIAEYLAQEGIEYVRNLRDTQ